MKMKNKLFFGCLFTLLFCFSNTLIAQMPLFEVESNGTGILIPRMTTTERNAISSPQEGLLLFDTNTNTFWYYDGGSWKEITNGGGGGSSTAWDMSGNSGTDGSINFIGTTDNNDFTIRTNNRTRLQVEADGDIGLSGDGSDIAIEPLLSLTNGQDLKISGGDVADFSIGAGGDLFLNGGNGVDASDGNILMANSPTSNVGINNTSPFYTLDVGGDIGFRNLYGVSTSGISIESKEDIEIMIDSDNDNPLAGFELFDFNGNNLFTFWEQGRLAQNAFAGTEIGGVTGSNEVIAHFEQQTPMSGHVAISVDANNGQDAILYLAQDNFAYWDIRNDADDDNKFQIRQQDGTGANDVRLTIDNEKVGIGTTSPDVNLDVAGTNNVTLRATTTTNNDAAIELVRSSSTESDWRIKNSVGGAFRLTYSEDQFATTENIIDVIENGTTDRLEPYNDITVQLGSAAYRFLEVHAQNGTIQTSDARLKKNINSIDYGLNTLMKMRPVSYDWKDGRNNAPQIGFLAQEMEKLVPEVVVHKKIDIEAERARGKDVSHLQEDIYGMNYANLIPVLVKSIQEQQTIIEKLQTELNQIKQQLED